MHWYVALPPVHVSESVLKVRHAFLKFLLTLLSSQLVYIRKQSSNSYSDMPASPAVDVLFQLPESTVSALLVTLLKEVMGSYHWLPVPLPLSYVGKMMQVIWTSEAASLDQMRDELGAAAMTVVLLLLNYNSGLSNPFSTANLTDIAESICVKALDLLDEQEILLLLFTLIRDNSQFRETFLRSTEQELYLPRLCESVYCADLTDPSPRLIVILALFLVLSTEDAYIRFINRDLRIGGVSWLSDYNTAGISLGSLLFLVTLRVFRENIFLSNGYLHAITVALLFNLTRNSFDLHEITAQSVLNTIVLLWRRGHDSDLLRLFMDIYGSLLEHTLGTNPWVVYLTLREADMFQQMMGKGVCVGIVSKVVHMVEYLLPRIEGEDVERKVKEEVRKYRWEGGGEREVLAQVRLFEVGDKTSWERWSVPQVWEAGVRKGLILVKSAGTGTRPG